MGPTGGIGLLGLALSCAALAAGGGTVPARVVVDLEIAQQIGPVLDAHFSLVLRNKWDRPVWANIRMAVNHTDTPPGLSEVWIEIRGPSGTVEFNCKTESRFADVRDYAVLRPNDAISRSKELRCFDELKAGETYTARAHYRDRNPQPPNAPDGAVYLAEEIVSAPVRFQVAAK